jgi:23S rRNA pseudouridine2605 synthase
MTDLELHEQRREKWRLTGKPLRTIEEARAFLELVGFSLFYPTRPATLIPTFLGAWCGTDVNLPTPQKAFSDPRVQEATGMMVRLLREHYAYEAPLYDENVTFLLTASTFPFFYALVGERNPKQPPKPGGRSEYSELACDTYAAIQRGGPISKQKLLETVGKGVSTSALDKSLTELWSKLRITRVDYTPNEGASWDVLYRWAPDAVREGVELSVPEALSALLSKYLDCVVAADLGEIETFLGNFVPRSRIKEAVNALLAARELEYVRVGSRTLIQITPPKLSTPVKPAHT